MVSTFRSTYLRINTEDMALRLDRFFTLSHMPRMSYIWIIGKKSGQKQNKIEGLMTVIMLKRY
jgi:hypothetical protein